MKILENFKFEYRRIRGQFLWKKWKIFGDLKEKNKKIKNEKKFKTDIENGVVKKKLEK